MTTSSLPANVTAVHDRHGKVRYRFRRKGWKSAYVKGEPGTAEFHASLAAILEEGPSAVEPVKSPRKIEPKSLDDLFVRMKHLPRWHKKGERTKLIQGRILERFADTVSATGKRYGQRPVSSVTVAWLDKILAGMADRPAAANELRKVLCGAFEAAIKFGWIERNPAKSTDRYADGGEFHTWTDQEIEQFRNRHPLGTMARLVLELALNTAARRCNIHKIERDHLRDGMITVAHAKGNNETSVPLLASTKAAIDALPVAPIRFLVTTQFGKPFTVAGLGNKMRDWCDQAGLPHCSMHGLRKATSRLIAEKGGTDAEGMAVTGHTKAETFIKYRAKADRTILAKRIMSNLGQLADVQPPENGGN